MVSRIPYLIGVQPVHLTHDVRELDVRTRPTDDDLGYHHKRGYRL